MPIERINQSELPARRPVTPLPVNRSVDTSDVIEAFNENENVVLQAAKTFARPKFQADLNFDPFDHMDGYEGFANDLDQASSLEEMNFLKEEIDKKQKNNKTIAAASFPQTLAGIASFIASDPTTLIPIGGAVHRTYRATGRILEGAAKTAAGAAAVETGREAFLQHNQPGRTQDEAVFNISAATLAGGLLGGAAGAARGAGEVPISPAEHLGKVTKKLERDLQVPVNAESTVGAKRAGTTLEDEEIAGLERTKKLFKNLPGFLRSPTLDGATSKSLFMRKFTEQMTDLGLVKNKNLKGQASEQSVELAVRAYDAIRVPVYKSLKENYNQYRTRFRKGEFTESDVIGDTAKPMTKQQFEEEVDRAVRNRAEHPIEEVRNAAQVGRQFYDGMMERGIQTGLFDEGLREAVRKTSPTFAPRNWKRNKILREMDRFKKEVMLPNLRRVQPERESLKDLSEEELDALANNIIDRITNATDGRIPYDLEFRESGAGLNQTGKQSSAKRLTLDFVSDADADEWIEHNFTANFEKYIRSLGPDMEIMERFQSLDFDRIKRGIQEDYDQLRGKVGRDKNLTQEQIDKQILKLNKEMGRDIRTAEGIFEKIRGTRRQTDDYSVPLAVSERLAMSWNFVSLLGDVVGSSIPDMARNVMVHGFNRSYGDLMRSLMTDIKGLKLASDDVSEIGTALDMTNSMTALKRANMDDFVNTSGRVDEVQRTVAQGVANLTGINIWNAAQRTFSGIITQNRMLEGIETLAQGGKLKQKEIANLASHGIDQEMADRIAKQFQKHGEKRRVVRVANARAWDDIQARETFRRAVRKQVDEIIVNPGFERPMWLTDPGWKMIGQFKSFSFGSMQRVTMAGLQQADAHTIAGTSVAIFLGANVYAYKQMMADREISDDPRVWITEGVDRSGITGWTFDVNNIIEKATRGTIGINALTGGPPMSRYAARNVTDALLGPSVGKVKSIFQVSGAAFSGDVNDSDIHAARRLLPAQNIPYLRGLYDKIEQSAKENIVENE